MNKLSQLNISLEKLGVTELNELQNQSFFAHEKFETISLYAPTGSGKTLAYLLPLISKLRADDATLQCVILVPARELALQIESVFKSLQSGFKINCCYGGHSVRIEKNNLSQSPAVLIGTPGRVAYHFRNANVDIKNVKHVVIDEFDKSLEFGFLPDIQEIYEYLPPIKFQTYTSATKMDVIPDCCNAGEPHLLDFLHHKTESKLSSYVVKAIDKDKLTALYKLICTLKDDCSIIFCNHREAVDRVSELLEEQGIYHGSFHGGMEQADRERTLTKFRNGSIRILLTTDLASRGIDIPEIDNVVHYQMPTTEDAHTHRNGRTARMHADGKVFYVLPSDGFLPDYITGKINDFSFDTEIELPARPEWSSLYFNLGKKDKINKVDIVGFLCKKGGLQKEELGLIEVLDKSALVAVKADVAKGLIHKLKEERLKNKKVKIAFSK